MLWQVELGQVRLYFRRIVCILKYASIKGQVRLRKKNGIGFDLRSVSTEILILVVSMGGYNNVENLRSE